MHAPASEIALRNDAGTRNTIEGIGRRHTDFQLDTINLEQPMYVKQFAEVA